MKKFNSPKVGGQNINWKNSIDFYKRWFRELLINPSVPFSFILMAVMSFYFLSCGDDHIENNQSQYAQTRELSDGACNIPYQIGCDTATIDTFITIDTCEVPVRFFRKICPGFGGVSFTFGHFVINNNSLQLDDTIYCDNLDTWSALWAMGNNSGAEAAWDNFRKLVSIEVEKMVILDFISKNSGNYDCESSSSVITIASSFIETNCKAICGEQEEGIWNLRDVVCGNGCCVRFTDYCIRNGQLIVKATHTDSAPGCVTVSNDCRGTLGNCRNSCAGL
ncbi:MAG: hypothetical protein KBF57_14700 [Saprospiraceae bacterium]|jgi:hypothetical protein|nr:hypothetical protein [Saprospiraceae bacterium]